jgi:hypothetical protein
MVWDPTERVVVAPLVAVPPLTKTAEPKFTPSMTNWTVPVLTVAVLGATPLTAAVKVTDWPKTDGFAGELTDVVVEAWFTVCVNVDDVLPLKALSPPYTAVIECEPGARLAGVRVAVPPDSTPVPSVVVPSLNVTVPVALLGETVAVKVTGWPNTEGLADEETVVLVLARKEAVTVPLLLPPVITVQVVVLVLGEHSVHPPPPAVMLQLALVLPVNVADWPLVMGMLQAPDLALPFHKQLTPAGLLVTVPLVLPVKASVTVSWPASVNVVCAWEVEPTAVRVNFTLRSWKSVVNELSEKVPSGWTVTVKGPWVSMRGDSTSVKVTVSPGCHPEPVIVTVVPGG